MVEETTRRNDDAMMRIAWSLASKSNGNGTKVGCIIADRFGKIVGKGFNVLPNEASSAVRAIDQRRLVIHAEMNALLAASEGGISAYCTLAPCFDCLKHLSFYGIRRIVYDHALGSNKTFSLENSELFSSLIGVNGLVIVNRNGVPFLEDLMAGHQE